MARERRKFSQREQSNEKQAATSKVCFRIPKGIKLHIPKGDTEEEFDVIPFIIKKYYSPFDKGKKYGPGTEEVVWPYFLHKSIGPNKKKVVCNQEQFGKPCAVCDKIRELQQNPDCDYETHIKPIK